MSYHLNTLFVRMIAGPGSSLVFLFHFPSLIMVLVEMQILVGRMVKNITEKRNLGKLARHFLAKTRSTF